MNFCECVRLAIYTFRRPADEGKGDPTFHAKPRCHRRSSVLPRTRRARDTPLD